MTVFTRSAIPLAASECHRRLRPAYALGARDISSATTRPRARSCAARSQRGVRHPQCQSGHHASPLVEGNLVIVQIGGKEACLVAFDKVTGKEVWKALNDNASYAASIMVEQADRRVMICLTGDNVVGMNPPRAKSTGSTRFHPTRWSSPSRPPSSIAIGCSSPLLRRQPDAATTTGQVGGRTSLATTRGAASVTPTALHSIMATPLLKGAYLYGVDSYGELRCLLAENGDRIWEDKTATPPARWSNIHMVENGENIWMFNERGELLITRCPRKDSKRSVAPSCSRADQGPTQSARRLLVASRVCESHSVARNDVEIVAASLAK